MSGLQGGDPRNPKPSIHDFDLGFEEEDSEIEQNPHEILPESPYLQQKRLRSNIHGQEAEAFAGRMSSPKLFAQQALFPQVTQLRCWKIENGIPTGIGVIDANSSEEDFVQKFKSAMPKIGHGSFKFKLRPLDMDGRELGQEITIAISEHHASLKNVGMTQNVGANQKNAEHQTMARMIDMLKDTLGHSQSALEEERRRTATLLEQMAQERIDLATNTASGIQIISERMMDADTKRHDVMLRQEHQRNQQAQDNMSTFFQTQTEMQSIDKQRQKEEWERQREREQSYHQMMLQMEKERSDRERMTQESAKERETSQFQMMLEQERARRDREMQEFRERQEQTRQEWERQRIQEREEYDRRERERERDRMDREKRISVEMKEKEGERLRQHEMRLKELELSAQRDREHSERMMQLQALQVQQEKQGSLKETMKEAMETLQGFGIDPMDLAGKLFGGGNDGGSSNEIIGALTSLGGKVADVVKENVKGNAMVKSAEAQAKGYQGEMPMYNPNPYAMTPYGMTPEQQMMMAQQGQFLEEDDSDDDEVEEQLGEMEVQQQVVQQAPPQQTQQKPKKKKIDLPLATQKSARKSLRNLVVGLSSEPNEKWEEMITLAIATDPSIYHYCQAVSVDYALRETGANDELVFNIIVALKKSSLVPQDLNYGE